MDSSVILTKERIISALEILNQRLTERGVTGELCIFRGATIILAFDAFLASTAAYLAQKHKLPVPDWAKGTSRALGKPWFAAKSHNIRMVLLQESPAAFRIRNLFVSANALHRA